MREYTRRPCGDLSDCDWQPATRKVRYNACPLFLLRHHSEQWTHRDAAPLGAAIDKAFDLKDWR